jgi:DNA-binding beta-propeller fold protein YncE
MEKITHCENGGKRKLIGLLSGAIIIAMPAFLLYALSLTTGKVEIRDSSKSSGNYLSSAPPAMVFHSGKIYVADPTSDVIRCYAKDGVFLSQWGAHGKRDGEFDCPSGIAVNSDGFIYVSDTGNHRIQVFHPDGKFIEKWQINSAANRRVISPCAITIDSGGIVYVADACGGNIQKFGPHGEFMTKFRGGAADSQKDLAVDHKECWQNPWNTCD